MRHDKETPNGDDPLGGLLEQAAWPTPDADRIERLRERWVAIGRSRRRRRTWQLASVAAAALLAVATVVWRPAGGPRQHAPPHVDSATGPVEGKGLAKVAVAPPSDTRDAAAPNPPDVTADVPANKLPVTGPPVTGPPVTGPPVTGPPVTGPPTYGQVYEQLLIAAHNRRLTARRARALPAADVPADDTPVARAVEQLARQPETEIGPLVQPLLETHQQSEAELAKAVRHLQGPEKRAAARLLTYVATWRSYGLLIELRSWHLVYDDATRAVARLSEPAVVARLAAAERSGPLKRQLFANLLARGNRDSVALYLRFVAEPTTAAAALEAAAQVPHPPVDVLFDFLTGPRSSQRLAAARVLGHCDDPAVSQRLIGLALARTVSREALVALVERSDPTAVAFLARAGRSAAWSGPLHAAYMKVQSFPN